MTDKELQKYDTYARDHSQGRKIQVTTAVGDTKEYGKTVTWRAPDPVKEIVGQVE